MIACRSLSFRFDSVLKYVNSCIKAKPVNYFKGCCSYHTLSFISRISCTKDRIGSMDRNNKQKRAVSIHANSIEGDGGQDPKFNCSISSSISNTQDTVKVAQTVAEVAESTLSTNTLECNAADGAMGGQSLLPAEKHSVSVEVGASLLRFIKGKGGSTQKNIEEEMGVKIIFPTSKEEESIIIEGSSIYGVTRAAEKIKDIIEEAVKSPNLDYSHFVSLPLAIHPELVDKLVNFQNSLLGSSSASQDETIVSDSNKDMSDNEDGGQELNEGPDVAVALKVEDAKSVKVGLTSIPIVSYEPKQSKSWTLCDLGIDKSIFIKPKTFHLTVLMLKLWNKKRVNAASEVLMSISSKVMDALDHRPVSVRLKGLDCMRGTLAKARVLYTTVEAIGTENCLSRACQVIIDAYVAAGLVLERDAKQKLKLHATVMNVRHRKGKKKRRNDSFDARGIFKQFGYEEWGEYTIREAHLSQRFEYDDKGYYRCCASILFPESMQAD